MEGNTGLVDTKMMIYSEEEFLAEVLAIPSVNGTDDERKMAWFLVEYLRNCGVNAVVQEIDKTHANVIAILEGKTQEKVVWNGHLDTVPYGKASKWDTQPCVPVKKNGCVYARGSSDMKSGLAAMVYVLGRMKQKGRVPRQTIYFFGTCDEEKGGIGASHIMKEHLMDNVSLLLIGEPTGLKVGLAQKGCIWLHMKIRGETSHGAYPEMGVNAIEYGMKIFSDIKRELLGKRHPLLGGLTIQITMIKGGIVPNMTPDEAELTLDIRTIPGQTAQDIMHLAEDIVKKYTDATKGRLSVGLQTLNERIAIETDLENRWVRKIQQELKTEDLPEDCIGINYFTDASILIQGMQDIPTVLFGPGEAQMAHKPNEYVEIKKYRQYIRMLTKLF